MNYVTLSKDRIDSTTSRIISAALLQLASAEEINKINKTGEFTLVTNDFYYANGEFDPDEGLIKFIEKHENEGIVCIQCPKPQAQRIARMVNESQQKKLIFIIFNYNTGLNDVLGVNDKRDITILALGFRAPKNN